MGVSLIALANAGTRILAVLLALPAGFSWLMLVVTNNTQIQTSADDSMRGRVMSFYATGALGSQALGALLLGSIADQVGVAIALMLAGAGCAAAAAISLSSRQRPWQSSPPAA
jgi:predicted MFS family arabinose efflux permease